MNFLKNRTVLGVICIAIPFQKSLRGKLIMPISANWSELFSESILLKLRRICLMSRPIRLCLKNGSGRQGRIRNNTLNIKTAEMWYLYISAVAVINYIFSI